MSFQFVTKKCTTRVPRIFVPPQAGGSAAIVVGACDTRGHPPGFAPRSPRHARGNAHLSKNTLNQSGLSQNDHGVAIFRMFWKSSSQNLQGKIPLLMVRYAHYPELTGHSLMYQWLRHVLFIAILMFLTTLENGPYRVIMCQQKATNRHDQIKRIPSCMSKHPVFLLHIDKDQWRPPVPWRFVCRPGWLQSNLWESQETDLPGTSTQHTG